MDATNRSALRYHNAELLNMVTRLPSLTALTFVEPEHAIRTPITAEAFKLSSLTHLGLVNVAHTVPVAAAPHLRRLQVSWMSDISGLLPAMETVRELELRQVQLQDKYLARILRSAVHLRVLKLVDCNELAWAALSTMAPSVPTLCELHVSMGFLAVDTQWSVWPQLRRLDIGYSGAGAGWTTILLQLVPQLEHLALKIPARTAWLNVSAEVFVALGTGHFTRLQRFDYMSPDHDISPVQVAMTHCPRLNAVAVPRKFRPLLPLVQKELADSGVGVLFREAI
jgi:hypothetical protein